MKNNEYKYFYTCLNSKICKYLWLGIPTLELIIPMAAGIFNLDLDWLR